MFGCVEGEVVSISIDKIYSLTLSPLLKRARFDWLFSLSATTLLYRSIRLRWAASRFSFDLNVDFTRLRYLKLGESSETGDIFTSKTNGELS